MKTIAGTLAIAFALSMNAASAQTTSWAAERKLKHAWRSSSFISDLHQDAPNLEYAVPPANTIQPR